MKFWHGVGDNVDFFQGQGGCSRRGGAGMSSSARHGDGYQLRNHSLSRSLSIRISLRSGIFNIGQG